MANNRYKPVASTISSKNQIVTLKTLNSSGLTYTFCDRTDLESKEANYFLSFKLPHTEDKLTTGSTLSRQIPEIQQLNVDNIIISPIPLTDYSEIIDGRSVKFTVPQLSGSTSLSAKTIVSSTYTHLVKSQDSILLGNNVSFLFCDEINLPRTGTTSDGKESVVTDYPRDTWDVTPFVNKPQAHSYTEIEGDDINTDQRPWSSVNLAVQVPENYPTTSNQGYNYDIPVGFVVLDKGFLVLTHPDIVDNIPWNSGQTLHTNTLNTGASSGTTDIYFTDPLVSQVEYSDIDINFKTSVVCLALPSEFAFSSNPSWDLTFNLQELNNGTNGFDPIQITEIGLYNKEDELIAVARLDRPVEKTYTNLITFNLDIDV